MLEVRGGRQRPRLLTIPTAIKLSQHTLITYTHPYTHTHTHTHRDTQGNEWGSALHQDKSPFLGPSISTKLFSLSRSLPFSLSITLFMMYSNSYFIILTGPSFLLNQTLRWQEKTCPDWTKHQEVIKSKPPSCSTDYTV